MRVWLDDIREMPEGFDLHARTFEEAIDLLKTGDITHLSFDHDLGMAGETVAKTGYDVAVWIESKAFAGKLSPLTWEIHSANPVGRRNIEVAMNNATFLWKQSMRRA